MQKKEELSKVIFLIITLKSPRGTPLTEGGFTPRLGGLGVKKMIFDTTSFYF
jgi:hypothetical protein